MSLSTQMLVAEQYGIILGIEDIAKVLGQEPSTARNTCVSGRCPFPVSKRGRDWVAHYIDVAEYLDTFCVAFQRIAEASSLPK